MAEAPFPIPEEYRPSLQSERKFEEVAWSNMQARRFQDSDGTWKPFDAIRVEFGDQQVAVFGNLRARADLKERIPPRNFLRAYLLFQLCEEQQGSPLWQKLEITSVEGMTDDEFAEFRKTHQVERWIGNECMTEGGVDLWGSYCSSCLPIASRGVSELGAGTPARTRPTTPNVPIYTPQLGPQDQANVLVRTPEPPSFVPSPEYALAPTNGKRHMTEWDQVSKRPKHVGDPLEVDWTYFMREHNRWDVPTSPRNATSSNSGPAGSTAPGSIAGGQNGSEGLASMSISTGSSPARGGDPMDES